MPEIQHSLGFKNLRYMSRGHHRELIFNKQSTLNQLLIRKQPTRPEQAHSTTAR